MRAKLMEGMMKRILACMITIVIMMGSTVYAQEMIGLKDSRNKMQQESARLKELMPGTQDPILVSSMWDSCLITATQIDAYFYMLNIFNTIERERVDLSAVTALADWLKTLRSTNDLTIKSLKDTSRAFGQRTKSHMAKLSRYYTELNERVDEELTNVTVIKNSLKKR